MLWPVDGLAAQSKYGTLQSEAAASIWFLRSPEYNVAIYCARAQTSCYEGHFVSDFVLHDLGEEGATIGRAGSMCAYLIKSHICTMPCGKEDSLMLTVTRVLVARCWLDTTPRLKRYAMNACGRGQEGVIRQKAGSKYRPCDMSIEIPLCNILEMENHDEMSDCSVYCIRSKARMYNDHRSVSCCRSRISYRTGTDPLDLSGMPVVTMMLLVAARLALSPSVTLKP